MFNLLHEQLVDLSYNKKREKPRKHPQQANIFHQKMRRVQSIVAKHALVNKPSQSIFQAHRFYATALNVKEARVAQFKQFGSASNVVKYVFLFFSSD